MSTALLAPWQPTTLPPDLSSNAIHVWRLSAAEPAAETLHWLEDNEQRRLASLRSPPARAQLLATRVSLRRILAGYLGCHPAEVRLQLAAGGKPFISAGPAFNLSHCQDLALLAVAQRPVGIDVERLRAVPHALQIARRVLDSETAARLAMLPAAQLDAAFLAAWTAMEARQKCHGEGVFGRRVEVADVGEQAFRPDVEHIAQLAWTPTQITPEIHWLTQPDHDLP